MIVAKKVYLKAPPGHILKPQLSLTQKLRLTFSLLLITIGIASLTTVIYPLLEYQLFIAPSFNQPSFLSPLAKAADSPTFLPEMINTSLDYTDITKWFPTASPTFSSLASSISYYTLSIPKLGIDHALVKIGESDLKQSLIQYPGTALPGQLGNPVIFGHSVLPQFFNPRNYTTIFATLHTLEPGDEIYISIDGAEYTYRVQRLYEVKPTNLSPLAQVYDGYHLTLITCTPPGTYLRRLIVEAVLQ